MSFETREIIGLILRFLAGISILCIFCFIISLISLIPAIRQQAQQESAFRKTTALVLGILVWACIFILFTYLVTDTSPGSPPHGVETGLWDGAENGELVGGFVFFDYATKQELYLKGMMTSEISAERLRRYLLPPFLRQRCFTGNVLGCKWTDIDINNFSDGQEWLEYSLRIGIGLLFGFMTSLFTWFHTEIKKKIPILTAG